MQLSTVLSTHWLPYGLALLFATLWLLDSVHYETKPWSTASNTAKSLSSNAHVSNGAVASALSTQNHLDLVHQLVLRDWNCSTTKMTMLSPNRLHALRDIGIKTLTENVQGDWLEAGVAAGGAAAVLMSVLRAYGSDGRKLWLADNWEGLPASDAKLDVEDQRLQRWNYLRTYEEFVANMDCFGFNDQFGREIMQILQGLFSDTLPIAPVKALSFLRLDGDMYISTRDGLQHYVAYIKQHMYPKLSVGGYVMIDDYGEFVACKTAVEEYRAEHGITDEIHRVMEPGGRYEAIWWKKTK